MSKVLTIFMSIILLLVFDSGLLGEIKSEMLYTDLNVWKQSRKLVQIVYDLIKSFPVHENQVLSAQMRRCSISIPSNIAEGCGRNSSKDSLKFLYISRGSLFELETQLYLAFDQNYISSNDLGKALEAINDNKKTLNGFIKYYKGLLKPNLESAKETNQQPTTNNQQLTTNN